MYPGVPGKIDDRQRRLLSFSRFPATPRSLLFERSEDGRAFQPIDEPPPVDEFTNNWRILRIVLEDAQRELTRQEILEQWPTTYPAPRPRTLWQWLNSAFEQGLVRIEGDGRRTDPFRYYLPEKMEEWEKDPIYRMMRISEQDGSEIQAKLGGCGFDNRRVAR
jgi:hypothetical protein